MKLQKLIFLSLFCLIVLIALPAYAKDTSSGCGLGWEVIEDKSFLGTIIRGTTHSILAPSFSMTFGTSGCDKHTIVKNEFKGIHYTEANYASLMVEMPQGNGEFLSGYAQILGCTKVDDTFKSVVQHNYEAIYATSDITPFQVYKNVLTQIEGNVILSTNCHQL